MTRLNMAIFVLLMTVFASPGVAQSVDTAEELETCAGMTDQDARLACFDKLGERVLREEPADKEPTQENEAELAAAAATETDVQPLPDEFEKRERVKYGGLITSCEKGRYGDWYFIFENGQVWKVVGSRKPRFQECNFYVTLETDGFGYKMTIEDDQGTFRVKHHK